MRTLVLLLPGALMLGYTGQPAHAQRGASLPNGPALGVSVTKFAEAFTLDETLTAITFRHSGLRANAVGLELDAGLFPQVLPGALLIAFDGGPGYNISLPGATLILRAGPGGYAALGGGGGGAFTPGVHLGASAIVGVQRRAGIRLDLLRHWYRVDDEFYPYWSLGFGFAVMSKQ
jgi:hypothetical protein